MAELTVGSLFSGIGGLDLGLERAGMRVIWQSEINPYACRVLKKHWPEVANYGNIKNIDWGNVVRPNVICGGYPCQPFSTSGNRNGHNDPRHLWPWVREAISRLRPDYAVLENVRGHLSLGGMSVVGDLAALGYDAEWRVISAASMGASHRRDRVVIVAYPHSLGNIGDQGKRCEPNPPGCGNDDVERIGHSVFDRGVSTHTGNDDSRGLVFGRHPRTVWSSKGWETQPNVARMVDGFPHRMDRVRGLGNAVVPQVAEIVGRLVMAHAQERP